MNSFEQNREFELLKEKYARHEKILIQAYTSLKEKERKLKELYSELLETEEKLRQSNEELHSTNEQLSSQKEELKASLDRLNETQLQLVQSEKMASLGVLAAGVAHEINNPLNFINGGILGIETYFKENLEDHISEVLPLIEAVNVGVKRASDIVSSLCLYSSNDNAKFKSVDINLVIENCLVLLRSQLRGKIEVEKEFTDSKYTIIGSEGKLQHALLNIIKNACSAIQTEGKICIRTFTESNYLCIAISDTGCGIDPKIINKIFDPFFTTKDPGEGTGLGLSITFKIIKEHNGTIEYESVVGSGTNAIIKLPILKSEK